jgi:phage terminase small subunit
MAKKASDYGIKLTPKQELFCCEYIIDFNGTQSAIRAGYSAKTAPEISAENLRKPQIQQYLEVLRKDDGDRLEVTRERIIKELSFIGFSRITDTVDFDCTGVFLKDSKILDEAAIAPIESISSTVNKEGIVTVNVKRSSKVAALEALANRFGYGLTVEDHIKAIEGKGFVVINPAESAANSQNSTETRAKPGDISTEIIANAVRSPKIPSSS